MWVRTILALAGMVAALLVARDAPNFPVVEAMIGLLIIAFLVVVLALLRRR
jgi:hypothetical protein